MLNWFTQTVTFYRQWQSEKSQRQYYEALSKTWMNQSLEQQDTINNLKAALQNCDTFDIPEITGGVVGSLKEIQDLFLDKLSGQGFSFDFLDNKYLVPPLDEISGTIVPFIIRRMKPYQYDFRDCDNFAFFMSAACSMWFGVNPIFPYADWEGAHMYNFIMPAEGIIHVLEPQTGQIWPYDTCPRDSLHTLKGGRIYGF